MKVLFVGGGNMATAMIGGMLARGMTAGDIAVVEPRADGRFALEKQFSVRCFAGADAAALQTDAVVLAVKPQQMREAAAAIAPLLGTQTIISIAAGIRLADLSRWLGGCRRLVRTMPNTPALIGAGVAGMHALPEVDNAGRQAAETILGAVGSTFWVDDEVLMDGVTAISGSGPAYVFYFLEALQDGAEAIGFTPAAARRMALDTVLGAAQLAAQSDESLATLRERVTSKGGTTEAALRTMRERGVAEGIVAGLHAAQQRGRELGETFGREG
jgi:pyrroline-5-carboxylate reductase